MKPSFFLIVALAASASTQIQAQGKVESAAGQVSKQIADACKTEIQQLCQGQKGKEAEQCLKNNESKLSAQCKSAVSK